MGGQRRFSLERCAGCGLHLELCACSVRPRVELPFRVIVVQNNRERHKPTNTGRQVVHSIVGAELLHWGVLEREGEGLHTAEFDDSALVQPGVDYRLIFPRILDPERPEATLAPELQREHFAGKTAVVLLDGTWTQCSRMSRRIAAVERMPAFRLPPGPDSHWGVRTATEASRISTYEAAVRVLEIAGELPAAAAMQEWFDLHSARMQFMKGKRSSPEVPAEWIAERERRFG
jgi:DTW domain-containing protein YfiP